jgi:hypothetical protein
MVTYGTGDLTPETEVASRNEEPINALAPKYTPIFYWPFVTHSNCWGRGRTDADILRAAGADPSVNNWDFIPYV